MRIAIGQLWQETNTFNRNPTTRADFENWGIAVGDEIVAQYSETGELGGFISACRNWDAGVEFAGLVRCACWPWGRVDVPTHEWIRAAFAEQLEAMGPVDGVLLALHGAMAADDEHDLTGALLAQVRAAVGPEIPVIGTLDLHANVTQLMLDSADLLVGYHACPHLDAFETGQRAVAGLRCMLEQEVRPTTVSRKLPMIVAAESHNTFTGPPAPLYRQLEALEKEEDILTAGIYMAMPWFDCPHLGWSVVLSTTGRRDAQQIVDDLAEQCWALRKPMADIERFPPSEVVARAKAHAGHPIVIGDGADATNSGAPGDSTHLLREFLAQQPIPHGALTFLVDPEAVATATQAGIGGPFHAFVGGSFAPEYSEPLEFRGTVENLLDVNFVLDGHIGKKLPIHMGRGAVVRSGDVTVLFTEKNGPGSSPLLYEAAGLDPRTCGIVVAKSPAGFRADYDPFVAGTYLADCPGCAMPDWPRLNFHNVHRPLWPLNAVERMGDAGWC
ncbi:hypothetical protein Pan258_25630 [Symmachiella dynata]|uniref:M81 family metallopeptidase n=1 Tax=Symmachiella dynata TaxID=2527995 RepID=UPI00118D343E|nr:M81 family metallopeptidase [Symmachiella dynata]QDT48521.1 hypothetical protein Pan258_25630 [Symmachiella dynata]